MHKQSAPEPKQNAYIDDGVFDALVFRLLHPAPSLDPRGQVVELLVSAGLAPQCCLDDPHHVAD